MVTSHRIWACCTLKWGWISKQYFPKAFMLSEHMLDYAVYTFGFVQTFFTSIKLTFWGRSTEWINCIFLSCFIKIVKLLVLWVQIRGIAECRGNILLCNICNSKLGLSNFCSKNTILSSNTSSFFLKLNWDILIASLFFVEGDLWDMADLALSCLFAGVDLTVGKD